MNTPEPRRDGAANLAFVVSEFPTAMPEAKEALGYMKETEWAALTGRLQYRREGPKDGPNLVFARFKLEPDSKRVRRLKVNVEARTAIALDVDGNKETGEIAPALRDTCNRITAQGWAAAIYTSHSHRPEAPRYRIVLPLTAEIPANLPAVEAIADILSLSGVLDTGKLGASSVFYLPSSAPGCADHHQTIALDGSPIDAEWIKEQASAILATREARQTEIRAAALAAAEARRAAKVAAGFKPTENLIEAIRGRLDLAGELLRHGYTKIGDRYLYPQSETGMPGVHILRGSDGVERCFSHHSGDPLAAGNLPTWCTTKGAIDAVDVAAILDFGGDFTKALHELAKRFDIGDRAAKQPLEEPPGFGDVPPPDDKTNTRPADAATSGSDHGWATPVDFLSGEGGPAPVLHERHIPAALWSFVTDTAERMGVDPAAVALCGLVACASVISDDWALQPKRMDTTWIERPRLWGAIVGDPSIMKTPIISLATHPIDKLEAAARKRHQDDMRQWRIDEAQAKQEKSALPPQPKCERFLVEGCTIEAIGEILREDDEAKSIAPAKKVLSRHDELSEFFGSLDKYKSGGKGGGDRGAYLRLYNGGRHTIDRIGRGSFAVPNWSACFLGGIQPGPIQRIARDSAEDGLLTRPMYCVPDHQAAGLDRKPDYAALNRYEALFPALVGLQPAPMLGSDSIKPLVFHQDAHSHREEIDMLARGLSVLPDTSPRLKASFGKWPGLFARLCLTFHLIDVADKRAGAGSTPFLHVIPPDTAAQVAAYMREIVLPHLMRAEATMFSTEQAGHAESVAGMILSAKLERITTRDLMRGYRPFKAPEARRELNAVMESLVAVGWLEPEESANTAKGVTSWKVNPGVHSAFAQQAAAESKRRVAAREAIAVAVAARRAASNIAPA